MDKWEYKVFEFAIGSISSQKEEALNNLGRQGWEAVCCNGYTGGTGAFIKSVILKRKVQP